MKTNKEGPNSFVNFPYIFSDNYQTVDKLIKTGKKDLKNSWKEIAGGGGPDKGRF